MIRNKTKRLVASALMLALGIILPCATSHAFGIPGTVFLPMHIPVFLCAFLSGPAYAVAVGAVLPILNSVLTGMPVMFPMVSIMTAELVSYGLVTGLVYRAFKYSKKYPVILLSLVLGMLSGRAAYGLMAWLLLLFGAKVGGASVVVAVVTGIPGIAVQIAIIPLIVYAIASGRPLYRLFDKRTAKKKISDGEAKCVVIREGRILAQSRLDGIAHLIEYLDKGILTDSFVADTIVGRAAAMIFTLGGVCACYAENMSRGALEWLTAHGVRAEYKTLSENIINRRGDGICPMEEALLGIEDDAFGVERLRARLLELKKEAEAKKDVLDAK